LEGVDMSWKKKLKISPKDMYSAAPKPISEFFFDGKYSDRGSLGIYSGSYSILMTALLLSESGWQLAV
jgi:hypothetical protein